MSSHEYADFGGVYRPRPRIGNEIKGRVEIALPEDVRERFVACCYELQLVHNMPDKAADEQDGSLVNG